MSLNFNFGDVKDHERVTTDPTDPKNWHPVAEAIAFYSMICGYNAITEKNYTKVAARLLSYQHVTKPLFHKDGQRFLLTTEDVKRFIGTRTNATPMTDAQFAKRLGEIAIDEASRLELAKPPSALSIIGEYDPPKETA